MANTLPWDGSVEIAGVSWFPGAKFDVPTSWTFTGVSSTPTTE